MFKPQLFFLFFSLLLIGCGGSQVADDGSWRPLFNGKNLDGWQRLNGNAEYTVEDNAILGRTKRNTPNTFLATQENYSDFQLEFEVLIDPYINTGVQIRSNSYSDYLSGRVHGLQIDIDPSERAWTGGIYDEARRGWIYPLELNPKAGEAFKPGEWNTVFVEAIGTSIKTWINDEPAAFLIDDLTDDGFIALQIHSIDKPELVGRLIKWRNIRIKTGNLEPKPGDFPFVVNMIPNNLSDAELEQGWMSLFNGFSTDLWRGAHKETFPSMGWEVKDETLRVLESGGGEARHGGDIVTKDEFGSFEFQMEFKLTEGANSGIKYFVTEEYDAGEGSAIGLEYQLLDDANHPDAQNGREGNRTLGSLYDLIPAETEDRFVNAPGKWNHARIIVYPNNHVEHWLNHRKVLEYERGSRAFLNLVAISKYKDWKDFGLADQGHVLLQDHGNEVSFRSIKIRHVQ